MSQLIDDQTFMQQALTVAKQGEFSARPNPCVGAVLVKAGKIIGEGYHARAGAAHAEMNALARTKGEIKGATLYVTLEPCAHQGKTPPCVKAIIDTGITRVVIASGDPNPLVNGQGVTQLLNAGIEVTKGVCKEEADALNAGFMSHFKRNRPFVRLKMAMSVDAKTAMATGESKWITGPASREDVQRLRARSGAVISGIGTVLKDDPSLTVHADTWLDQPMHPVPAPLRVVVDSQLKISPNAKLFKSKGPVWVISTEHRANADKAKISALEATGATIKYLPAKDAKVDLMALLYELSNENIHDVLVESGSILAGSFIEDGLVDELWCYIAPKVLGSNTKGLLNLPQINALKEHVGLSLQNIETFSDDVRLIYRL